jgi:hypothetical protein
VNTSAAELVVVQVVVEFQLRPRRRPGWRWLWEGCRKAQMCEDLGHDQPLGDRRDDLQPSRAARTVQHIHVVDPLEQRCPVQRPRPRGQQVSGRWLGADEVAELELGFTVGGGADARARV